MSKLVYLKPRNFKHLSRYRLYYQIADTDNNVTYFESPNAVKIDSKDSTFHVVEDSEDGRLDIIAKRYYGSASMYWVIAMANNIIDPMTVIAGTVLEIPSYESLYENGGPLIRRG